MSRIISTKAGFYRAQQTPFGRHYLMFGDKTEKDEPVQFFLDTWAFFRHSAATTSSKNNDQLRSYTTPTIQEALQQVRIEYREFTGKRIRVARGSAEQKALIQYFADALNMIYATTEPRYD